MSSPSRNAPCSCGSGKKYKLCCLPREAMDGHRESASLVDAAIALYGKGDSGKAELVCRQTLAAEPRSHQSLHLLAIIAQDNADFSASATLASEAIQYEGGRSEYYNTLGNALQGLKEYDDAVIAYEEALRLRQSFTQARNNLGNALAALGRHAEAVAQFKQALAVDPKNGRIHANLSFSLFALGHHAEAIACGTNAVRIEPRLAEVHCMLGDAYNALALHEEARRSLQLALGIRPDFAHAFNSLGNAYRAMRRPQDAATAYQQAALASPERVEYRTNLAKAFMDQGLGEEALDALNAALQRDPNYLPALEGMFHVRRLHCAWDGLEDLAARYHQALRGQIFGNHPISADLFDAFTLPLPPLEQRALVERLTAEVAAPLRDLRGELPPLPRRMPGRRLRIGYLSADFRSHATAHLAGHLFARHKHDRFEIIAYSTGPNDGSDYRRRFEREAESFVDMHGWLPLGIAGKIRADEVDILVDLHGHTLGNSIQALALRPARLQVHFLGYAGTVGKELVDYSLVDAIVCPPEHEQYYSEQVYRLPDVYQINDHQVIGTTLPRASYGLPEKGFVFCCFNASYKITPEVFAAWLRILDKAQDSVLWLYHSNQPMARNLLQEAERHGIASGRVILGAALPKDQHLARLRHADLMLDTPTVNAMTTASDALWAGVPILSILGESFPSRAGASILTAIGLSELIMPNLETYEKTAVRLAGHPDEMAALKTKLAANRLTHPLFDTARFVRNLEAAYEELWARHEVGADAGIV
jgi:protein O-GlcNAc transferase